MKMVSRITLPRRRSLAKAGRGLAITLLLLMGMGLSGCAASSSSSSVTPARSLYESGRYHAALEQAKRVQASTGSFDDAHAQAAYIAGASAWALHDLEQAETNLAFATRATDTETTGKAKALLGLIRMQQGRPGQAAEHFESAARLLEGDEAANAAWYAGVAHQQAGDHRAAGDQFALASAYLNPGEDESPTMRDDAGRYTLQIGVFRSRSNAESAAKTHHDFARRYALGGVQIEQRNDDDHGPVYYVTMGDFRSRQDAIDTRARIGDRSVIVAHAE